jgi:hypothetical protein
MHKHEKNISPDKLCQTFPRQSKPWTRMPLQPISPQGTTSSQKREEFLSSFYLRTRPETDSTRKILQWQIHAIPLYFMLTYFEFWEIIYGCGGSVARSDKYPSHWQMGLQQICCVAAERFRRRELSVPKRATKMEIVSLLFGCFEQAENFHYCWWILVCYPYYKEI